MTELSSVATQVDEFEKVMDRFFRQHPVEEAQTAAKRAVDEFNAWMQTGSASIETERAALEKQIESLRSFEAEIEAMDRNLQNQQPASGEASSVGQYNHLVEQRNALVDKQQALAQEYQQKQDEHNRRVGAFNQEAEQRKNAVEGVTSAAEQNVTVYQRWLKERGPEQFFDQLNQAYASVMRQVRGTGTPSPETHTLLGRLKGLRNELAAYAKKQQANAEHGFLLLPVKLCGAEECTMMIDSGASVTSMTPEMVDILGIHDCVGEEVELNLPNAIRIKAPQLLIPKISVQGQEAEYVRAVVLKETMAGVDGCLGLSFLHRFQYAIEKDKLQISPLAKSAGGPRFDVFICHKSEDLTLAKEVFTVLTDAGYHPFLSEVSMPETHSTEYQKAIEEALEGAAHLVVAASSRQHIEAPWVQSEWRIFDGLKRSGKKHGNIVPVLQGMAANDIPLGLQMYHAITTSDPDWKKDILGFLPR